MSGIRTLWKQIQSSVAQRKAQVTGFQSIYEIFLKDSVAEKAPSLCNQSSYWENLEFG